MRVGTSNTHRHLRFVSMHVIQQVQTKLTVLTWIFAVALKMRSAKLPTACCQGFCTLVRRPTRPSYQPSASSSHLSNLSANVKMQRVVVEILA